MTIPLKIQKEVEALRVLDKKRQQEGPAHKVSKPPFSFLKKEDYRGLRKALLSISNDAELFKTLKELEAPLLFGVVLPREAAPDVLKLVNRVETFLREKKYDNPT